MSRGLLNREEKKRKTPTEGEQCSERLSQRSEVV
jgi:hypothetical protein